MVRNNNSMQSQDMSYGLWLFIAALFVRLVYFAWSQSSPFLYQLSADEAFYIDYARHILEGKDFAYANFMDPLLAYLLAIPLHFSNNTHWLRLLFLVIDSVSALLLYRVCFLLTGNAKAALLAGVLYVFYSLLVIYSVFITKSTLIVFFLLLISYQLLLGVQQQRHLYFVLAGIFSALLVFLGAAYLLLAIVYGMVLMLVKEWRRYAFVFSAGFCVVIVIYTAWFHFAGTEKTVLPTNGGEILYISNHAQNTTGTHEVPDFVQESTPVGIYQAFKQQALQEDSTLKNDSEISAFWTRKTLAENIAQPHLFVGREINKIRFLLSNNEISQNYYLPYIKEKSLRGIPLLTFALVFAFGISGLFFFGRFDKQWLFVLLPSLVVLVSCLLFFVSARMRLPLVPFLMLGCSGWIMALQATKQRLLAGVVLCGMLLAASLFSAEELNRQPSIDDEYNMAVVLMNAKMLPDAERLIDSVIEKQASAKALFLKAVILSMTGRCDKAIGIYDAVKKQAPGFAGVDNNRQLCMQNL